MVNIINTVDDFGKPIQIDLDQAKGDFRGAEFSTSNAEKEASFNIQSAIKRVNSITG